MACTCNLQPGVCCVGLIGTSCCRLLECCSELCVVAISNLTMGSFHRAARSSLGTWTGDVIMIISNPNSNSAQQCSTGDPPATHQYYLGLV
jgi:hypothetical protein